ncbi:hypothetical protein PVAP13_6KG249300 [Panicum virgatum]|uniref:Uncharacterized protein n=1 Tax=Panicum virgatum TaxID=38727 RepID=A0A8T0RDF9_PANVG|nr:hypothetical protein PVAP13_6KG250912 [Panicum virgatum]KAG2583891.1 hypothetical protein PVAP13_6KG249300 [Panicum virgatum]
MPRGGLYRPRDRGDLRPHHHAPPLPWRGGHRRPHRPDSPSDARRHPWAPPRPRGPRRHAGHGDPPPRAHEHAGALRAHAAPGRGTAHVWAPVITADNFNRAALPLVDAAARIVSYIRGWDVGGLGERVLRGRGVLHVRAPVLAAQLGAEGHVPGNLRVIAAMADGRVLREVIRVLPGEEPEAAAGDVENRNDPDAAEVRVVPVDAAGVVHGRVVEEPRAGEEEDHHAAEVRVVPVNAAGVVHGRVVEEPHAAEEEDHHAAEVRVVPVDAAGVVHGRIVEEPRAAEEEDHHAEEVLVGEEGRLNEDAEGGGADGELQVEGEAVDGAAAVFICVLPQEARARERAMEAAKVDADLGELYALMEQQHEDVRAYLQEIEAIAENARRTRDWTGVPQAITHLRHNIDKKINSYKVQDEEARVLRLRQRHLRVPVRELPHQLANSPEQYLTQ